MNTRAAAQPRDFILYPQLPTLQLSQLEIVRRWMLKRFRQFRFKHPVALFEFYEMRRYSHSPVSLGVRRSADDSFVTRPRNQVDVTKPMVHRTQGIELPVWTESFMKN
jgi:hypothetical protein